MFRRERSRSDVFALEIAEKHLSLLYKSSLHFTTILFNAFTNVVDRPWVVGREFESDE